MGRFDDLGPQKAREAEAAFEAACRALDVVSTAQHPAAREAYEQAVEAAIRRAATSNKHERDVLIQEAIKAIIRGLPH
jgi:hypothetical protein